jgi:hypothetical protein
MFILKTVLFQTLFSSCFLLFISTSCGTKRSSTATLSSSNIPQLTNGDPFDFQEVATDKKYGYTAEMPIKVGGESEGNGSLNQRKFLNALAGPNGEKIKYNRIGSCCPYKTDKSAFGTAFLDKYQITWDGQEKPIVLLIDFYEKGILKIPFGLTKKN